MKVLAFVIVCVALIYVVSGINVSIREHKTVSLGPTPNFDWVRLRKYLFYAWASYQANPAILSNWTCCWCNATVPKVTVTHITEGDGTQGAYGFIGYNTENEIIVSFRGAFTDLNWIDVFQFWLDKYPYASGALVEHGFWMYWQSIQAQVLSEVQKLQARFPTYAVISTGHSLGGSLSLLAAVDLVRAGVKNVQVWNYGQPRVGNLQFAEYVTSVLPTIIRVTNHHDIAPRIPPRPIDDYTHTPTEVWFGIPGNFQNYTICSTTDGEDPACIDSVDPVLLTPVDHNTYLGYNWAPC